MLTIKSLKLDKTRTFDLVFSGEHGLRLCQDGKLFSANGLPIGVETSEPPDKPLTLADDFGDTESSGDINSMHWTQLRVLVESYGAVWQNKEAAIAFLRGQTP